MKTMTKNNKGFTLIELIIVMSIFSIIIVMGYNLINKYDKTTSEQRTTTDVQMAINTINRYITKDLEKASGVTLKINDEDTYSVVNGEEGKEEYLKNSLLAAQQGNKISLTQNESNLTYKYIINTSGGLEYSTYEVDLSYKKNSKFIICSISRSIENESNIELLRNHKIMKSSDEFSLPLVISNNNPYNVAIELQEKSNKMNTYSFDVASRTLVELSNGGGTDIPNPPNPDEIPIPSGFGNYSMIGFWTANKSICKNKNLYTWIMDKGDEEPSGSYGTQVTDGPFRISGDTRPEDSHKASSHIEYRDKWTAEVKDRSIKYKNVSRIGIYVSQGAVLNDVIFDTSKGQGVEIYFEDENGAKYDKLYGGQNGEWYECTLNITKNNPKVNFMVNGELSIDGSVDSGYAVVVYGESNSSDIIFEFLDLTKGPNDNQRTLDLGTAYKSNLGSFIYDKKDNVVMGDNQMVDMQVNLNIQTKNGTLSTFMQPGGRPSTSLTNDNIYKDLSKMRKIRITMDEGVLISPNTSNYNTLTKINNTTYEAKIDNGLNIDFKFDISNLYMSSINSGRVYIELSR